MLKNSNIWLVVDSRTYGGIEAHIYHLALLLKSIEQQVCVVLIKDYGRHPLVTALEQSGIEVVICQAGFRSLLHMARQSKPMLIHSHGYKAGLLSRMVGLLSKVPVVHTHHAGEKGTGKLGVYMALDKWSAFLNTKNIAVSMLIQNSLPCASQLVNNFVGMPRASSMHGDKIAFVGRLSEEKGPLDFMRLAKSYPLREFHFYGDGPMRKELEGQAGGNCIFHGHANMSDHWADIDILIISSKYEGLPLAALEAMAHGVPVVGYRVGDLPRLISVGENGFLTKSNTLLDLAVELRFWFSLGKKEKESVRDNARLQIKKSYSLEALSNQYKTIYSQANVNLFSPKSPRNVLVVHYGDQWIRGSEVCLIELCKTMDRSKWKPIVWTNVLCLAEVLREHGVETVTDKFTIMAGWENPRWNFWNYFRLRCKAVNVIHSKRIALVHCNNAAPNQWMIPVAKKMGIPVLCQLHSMYQFRDRMSLLINEADALIGVSGAVLRPLKSDHFQCRLQKVIFNGIDLKPHHVQGNPLREELMIPCEAPVVMTVGSLIRRKGVDLILESMRYLNPELHLVVIGQGAEQVSLVQLADHIGVSERVHWLGERRDVSRLLRSNVSAFVSGAREEAFGLVLVEAGLAKVPVVAPRVGGIPEVLSGGECGVLVEPENACSLADGIRSVLEDDCLAEGLSDKFYEYVLSNFESKENAIKLMNVYESLCERGVCKTRFFDLQALCKIMVECIAKKSKFKQRVI